MKIARAVLLTGLATLASLPAMADPAVTPAPESQGGLPQFDPHWFPSQILWLAITFGVLYIAMATILVPRVGGTIKLRQQKVDGDINAAEAARSRAAAAKDSYEQLMSKARHEATQAMNAAVADTKAEAEKRIRALQDRGLADAATLEKRLNDEKQKAKNELQSMIADIASAAAEKIVGVAPDAARARGIVQSLRDREAA